MLNLPRSNRRFSPRKTGDATPLGELERAVMGIIWSQAHDVSVGDVHLALPESQRVAYTTVKTTMERLAEKGILAQTRGGKAYLYRAAISQQELEQQIVAATLDRLMEDFPDAVAAFFVRPDAEISNERLERLSELVRRRQEEPDV
jgi:BlaI family transcriptional regulator, penicillinase repressor